MSKRGVVEETPTPEHPRLFKSLYKGGVAPYQSNFIWPLPTKDGPGEWVTVEGDLVACRNGYHFFDASDQSVRQWAKFGTLIYEVEVDGEVINDMDKWVARRARLTHLIGEMPSSIARDGWSLMRQLADKRDRRYRAIWDRWFTAKQPALVKKIGLDRLGVRINVLSELAKIERAKFAIAKLTGTPDTQRAKARRRAIRKEYEVLARARNARMPYSYDTISAVRNLAEWLGVKPRKQRIERLAAAREARAKRYIERELAKPNAYAAFMEKLRA